ncbi:hypothetical protein LBW62_23845 [Ralstonia solanacearum]|uniref:hypothetical protein n=1 Tax=Ralstonia solanacearum TaxID=305 RepID=UPI0005C6953D|nr:hypothetical protein [Ralstonia solanacearum]MDB0544255.1 hypothetical protein [Ralstonia solanacearum]MDB0554130.1 hypothetical protein [Ralstonia solanacearum]MDB0559207.1 hypothetical protein [Ralstonia solanacearum]
MDDIYTPDEARALMQAHSRAGGQRAAARDAQSNPLALAIESGVRALGYADIGNVDAPTRIKTPAVGSSQLDLTRALTMAGSEHGVFDLTALRAGETSELDPLAVVRQYSMCARAGATLYVPPANIAPGYNFPGGAVNDTILARVTHPATFAGVADGADVAVSNKPVLDESFSQSDMPAYASRFTITRAERRALGGALLEDELTQAVMMGLGTLIDTIVMTAVAAATPTPFSFGKLAALHLGLGDVSAVVGTGGAGVKVWPDGEFRTAQGIPAKLTAGHAGSFIGVWNRAFVALWPTVAIHAKRTNTSGDLDISVFANAKCVLPDTSSFWAV